MSFLWAALMPHPPVLVPEVGKGREGEAAATIEGTKRLCAMLREANAQERPEALLVLSPHQPHAPGSLFLNTAPEWRGNLARFGASEVCLAGNTPLDALAELMNDLRQAGIPAAPAARADISSDHGSIVPLFFVRPCFPGDALPPVLFANPAGLSPEQAVRLGECLRALPAKRRWALLASGDLSHRLKKDGPYGFTPEGPLFDKAVQDALQAGDPAGLLRLPRSTRENAGECGLCSVLTLLALAREPVLTLSYEGPFGVGYCNAFWRASAKQQPHAAQAAAGSHPYPKLARMTVSAQLKGEKLPDAAAVGALAQDRGIWSEQKGCFVSIKNKDGSLRGCIGTFLPTQPGLDAEIMANAVAAATRDPRFAPMREAELSNVRFSVDVLNTPELVRDGKELDPSVYGVIVTKEGRRGLLLPDLEGVDSVERQLSIAAQKGGISNLDGAQIYRFTVDRHREEDE